MNYIGLYSGVVVFVFILSRCSFGIEQEILKPKISSTMTSLIIAALMALGLISTPADFENATQEEQSTLTEIVIADILGG